MYVQQKQIPQHRLSMLWNYNIYNNNVELVVNELTYITS